MSTLLTAVIWLLAMATLVAASETQRGLLVDYVPPSLLQNTKVPERPKPIPTIHVLATPPPRQGYEARLARFEAEFGLAERKPTLFEGALYRVDYALFSFKDFVEHRLNFDYRLSKLWHGPESRATPRRYRDNLLLDALENAHLKAEIKPGMLVGQSYVGLKLVLPMGD